MMKPMIILAALLYLTVPVTGSALADDLYIYPTKGQSHDQMEKDKYNCYEWAKKQSGFDPMEQPKATAPPPQQEAPQGGILRGAALGAIVGGIAGDAGKGAAAGAVIGGVRRRSQVRDEEYQQNQWAQNQSANYAKNRDSYNRAYSACLEGKGYTVK
jgi:hypothetical protein